ncbi:MAG: hypothetical protein ACFFD8_10975, partial [Candidatus Thorarchaeota archaeon]
AHALDYGGFNLSLRAFPAITEILMQAAEEVCSSRLVVLLSGGSEVLVAKHAISSIIRTLAGLPLLSDDLKDVKITESKDTQEIARRLVDKILIEFNSE